MNTASLTKEGTAGASTFEKTSPTPYAPTSGKRIRRPESAAFKGSVSQAREIRSVGSIESSWIRSSRFRQVCIWKRILDILCVLLSLPVTLPLMGAVALWIKLVSRGPAIFRQERIGRNGRRFTLYKFRSMYLNADTKRHSRHFSQLVQSNSPMVKLDLLCDSRLIPLGCLLRAAGLDELPQLWNVMRGEMSLVGPRPCLPEEYRFFSQGQRVRFQALPGLTGIWQTQGKDLTTFTEMNEMDARYVRSASPLLDMGIMLRTPLALMQQMRLAARSGRAVKPAKQTAYERFGDGAFRGCGVQRLR